MQNRVVYHVDQVKPFSPPGADEEYSSKLLIDKIGMGSELLILNEFTLKPERQTYQGDHGIGYDEVYFIISGKGELYLESLETGEYESFTVKGGSYAFIKGGRGHYIVNTTDDEDLVLLTFMPKNPPKGVNTLFDARLEKWGTSFKLTDEDTKKL